jgi:peptide/nickel transport system permease protein
VSWPGYTRLVRGQALSVREVAYVEAARAVGANTRRIVARHILPNVLSPIIVSATLDFGTIVLATAALSFLGVGAQPYQPEWGIMIQRGYQYMISGYWWEFLIPGIAIFLFVLAFNLLGDGARDILDPRLRR